MAKFSLALFWGRRRSPPARSHPSLPPDPGPIPALRRVFRFTVGGVEVVGGLVRGETARARGFRGSPRAPRPRGLSRSRSRVFDAVRLARRERVSARVHCVRVSEPQVDARRGWGWGSVRVGPRRAFRASARPAWRGRRRPTRRTDVRPPSWARVRGIRRREPRRSRRGRRRRSSVRPRAPPSGNCIAPRAPACRIASDRIGSRG